MKFPRISRGTLLAVAAVIGALTMAAVVVFTAPVNTTAPPTGHDSFIIVPDPASVPPVTSTMSIDGTTVECSTYRDAIICLSDGLPDGWSVGGKLRTAEDDGWDLLFAIGGRTGRVYGFTTDSRDDGLVSGLFTVYTVGDLTCFRAERVWHGGHDETPAPRGCFFVELDEQELSITVQATS